MRDKIIVDTNVVLRFLLNDDEQQAKIAHDVLTKAQTVVVALPVLCEVVWVLSQGYKMSNDKIALAIEVFLKSPKVKADRTAVKQGLALLRANGDFADGIIFYEGRMNGGEVFVSFDKKAISILQKKEAQHVRLL